MHHFLNTDLSLSELNVSPHSSLPMSTLLRSLASSLSQPISIRSRSDTGSNPLEDSLYLLHSTTKSIHVLSFCKRKLTCREKSEWMGGWKSVYQSLEKNYEEIMESVEKWEQSGGVSDRDQFLSIDRPNITNKTKLVSHLQWKALVHFLEIADPSTIQSFVYDSSLLPLSHLNWAALPIVLNTTLQLQVAYDKFQKELPRSLKHPKQFTNVEICD